MIIEAIPAQGLKDISYDVLDENKKLKLFPSEYWRNLDWNTFRLFCHVTGRYGIPTIEMLEFLRNIIDGRETIEIGAGNGDLGYHLNIHMTDSKLQNKPVVKISYMLMGQPTIEYPDDVEELESISAVLNYKPKVVIGSWVTAFGNPTKEKYGCNLDGINENLLLNAPGLETYILIGNKDQHGDKPIMELPHDEYIFDWHVSRAKNQDNNRIWVWNIK